MEDVTWQAYFLPWWKPLVYLLGSLFTLVGLKVGLTFNINTWLQDRRRHKLEDRLEQTVAECGHVWTLYPNSDFSQCNLGTAYIKTSTLMFARAHFDEKPMIVATSPGLIVTPGEGSFLATSYVGKRK